MKQRLLNIFILASLVAITFFNLVVLAGQHRRIDRLENLCEAIYLIRK